MNPPRDNTAHNQTEMEPKGLELIVDLCFLLEFTKKKKMIGFNWRFPMPNQLVSNDYVYLIFQCLNLNFRISTIEFLVSNFNFQL